MPGAAHAQRIPAQAIETVLSRVSLRLSHCFDTMSWQGGHATNEDHEIKTIYEWGPCAHPPHYVNASAVVEPSEWVYHRLTVQLAGMVVLDARDEVAMKRLAVEIAQAVKTEAGARGLPPAERDNNEARLLYKVERSTITISWRMKPEEEPS